MAGKSVFGIAKTEQQAVNIVEGARDNGFSGDDVSVIFPDTGTSREFAFAKGTKAPEGATTGAVTGGVVGGVAGWLVGIGSLAIPGLGPFVAAGPIMAALSGAAAGAATGGIAGALVGMGIPEFEAKRYEGRVKGGDILISVHVEDRDETKRAKEIFERAGAEDISTAGEKAA